MAAFILSADRLRTLLHYDPETGIFTRKVAASNATKVGATAGVKTNGYLEICVDGKKYKAHRLAWLYVNGEWPKQHIDHINGNRTDNRISNLRDVNAFTNLQNMRGPTRRNGQGLMGAYRSKNRFTSKIRVNGKYKHLGCFGTAEEASAAFLAAKRELHAGCTI